MNKKILSIILVMALTFGPCIMAFATGSTNANATRNSLKSQGNIVYTDGDNTVAIFSADLYHIADQLDSFKMSLSNQLAAIHTYFTTDDAGVAVTTDSDVKIMHTVPASTDSVDPLAIDFDTLLEGLAASQSIPTDVTEYGYSADTNLYKTETGLLTTDSTGAAQIDIAAATAENLSAGTAAWVNGNLILGTGADNAAYYEMNTIDSQSLSVASAPNSYTKGKYLYFLVHSATAGSSSSSLYFYVNAASISNPSVNHLTRLSCENISKGIARSIEAIYLIDVVDECASINIGVLPSTNSSNNVEIRLYCKLQ
jgi:hypothetical protein